ncbi:MAG: hypothetical protein EBV77_13035 [Gemmatimonadaceae bacterium]|nr:hypothetical protein [Gemmatimonadaceae bacterium]
MYTTSFAAPGQRTGLRRPARLAAYSLFALVIPSLLGSQPRRRCPQFARVPGYGACTNISGPDCGFCTYRCNDDTVVRWNVCGSK